MLTQTKFHNTNSLHKKKTKANKSNLILDTRILGNEWNLCKKKKLLADCLKTVAKREYFKCIVSSNLTKTIFEGSIDMQKSMNMMAS